MHVITPALSHSDMSHLVQLLKCTHAFLMNTHAARNNNYWPKYNNIKLEVLNSQYA